jgi:hypothetical protein
MIENQKKSTNMFYLMEKTHNKTLLKYLCRHYGTRESCFKYCGSGTYWKRHLKKHGKDLSTEILFKTNKIEKLKQKGLYYSNLYNIVKSDVWANLVPEAGEGTGWWSGKKGKNNPNYRKVRSKETRQKISQTRIKLGVAKGKNNPNFGRGLKGHLNPLYGRPLSEETKRKISIANKGKLGLKGSKNPSWNGGTSYAYRKRSGLLKFIHN